MPDETEAGYDDVSQMLERLRAEELKRLRRKRTGKVHELSAEDKLLAIQKYIGDLTFTAPEIFPSGQQVQYRVGLILDMWPKAKDDCRRLPRDPGGIEI